MTFTDRAIRSYHRLLVFSMPKRELMMQSHKLRPQGVARGTIYLLCKINTLILTSAGVHLGLSDLGLYNRRQESSKFFIHVKNLLDSCLRL